MFWGCYSCKICLRSFSFKYENNVFILRKTSLLHYHSEQKIFRLKISVYYHLHFVSVLEKQTTRHSVSTETETKSTTHENCSLNTRLITGNFNMMFLGNYIQIHLDKNS